jgi:hypothetical protein
VRRGSLDAPPPPGIPQVHQVKLVNHKNCQEKYHNETGSVYIEQAGGGFDGAVGTSEICVVVAGTDSSHMDEGMGPCTGDLGLPLTAKVKGVDGKVLLGLSHADECGAAGPYLPAVFTRVSSSLQWIRASVPELGRHPEQFTLELNVTKLGLPEGAKLSMYHGANFNTSETPPCDDDTTGDCALDTKCQVPFRFTTAQGAMLLILEMPQKGDPVMRDSGVIIPDPDTVDCDKKCVDDLGFTARYKKVRS